MSAYKEFKRNGFKRKTNIIEQFGVFVAKRQAHGCEIRLFAIRDFFVEVWSTQLLPWRNILRIKSFQKPQNLDPYLDQVDVKGVLSA
jgi:hypothetical protein